MTARFVNIVTPEQQLDALVGMALRLPDQERHEVNALNATRRRTGHMRWLTGPAESRLFEIWRKHVRGDKA